MRAKPTSMLLYRGIDGKLRWIVKNHLTEAVEQFESAHGAMICMRRWFADNETVDHEGDRKRILLDLERLLMREEQEKVVENDSKRK